ncbi:MAG: hypothetical protein HY211_04935 [Candidatus Omnitrophica bacterium]|nr:hypothetical protein [Candidatus Omnitrophota bacterium]
MRENQIFFKILAGWITLSQILGPVPVHACPELSRRALRSESAEESAGVRQITKRILSPVSAGLEEKKELTEEELLDLELKLIEGVATWDDRIRAKGVVNSDHLLTVLGGGHIRTQKILPAVQQYNSKGSKPGDPKVDIYMKDDEDLEPTGQVGVWRGPAGTLFIGRRLRDLFRTIDPEIVVEAFQGDDFSQLIAVAYPEPTRFTPLRPVPPASPPEEIPNIEKIISEGRMTWAGRKESPVAEQGNEPIVPEPAAKLDLGAFRETLRHLVPSALSQTATQLLPNSLAYNQTEKRLGVDTTDFPGASLYFIRIDSGELRLTMLVPDPGVYDLPRRYVARVDPGQARKRLTQPKNSPFKDLQLLEPALPSLSGQIVHSKEKGREALKLALGVLEQKDKQGKTAPDRLAMYQKRKGVRSSEEVNRWVQAVRAGVERLERIGYQLWKATATLRRGEHAGKIPVEVVREAMNQIQVLADLVNWPHLQKQVQVFLDETVPLAGEVTSQECYALLNDLRDQALEINMYLLLEKVGPEVLQLLYYDASRTVLSEKIRLLQGKLDQATSLETLREVGLEITAAVAITLAIEIGGKMSELVVETAQGVGGVKVTNSSLAVGLLCLDERMEPQRFIPGGGNQTESGLLVGHFPLQAVRHWAQGHRVAVLVYPTFSGKPNLDQVDLFLKDGALLRKSLGSGTEIWLGMARVDGSLAVYRPLVSLEDPVAWSQLYRFAWRRLNGFDQFASVLFNRMETPPESPTVLGRAVLSDQQRGRQNAQWVRGLAAEPFCTIERTSLRRGSFFLGGVMGQAYSISALG